MFIQIGAYKSGTKVLLFSDICKFEEILCSFYFFA